MKPRAVTVPSTPVYCDVCGLSARGRDGYAVGVSCNAGPTIMVCPVHLVWWRWTCATFDALPG